MGKRTFTTRPMIVDETKADTKWIVTDGELQDQSYIVVDTEPTDQLSGESRSRGANSDSDGIDHDVSTCSELSWISSNWLEMSAVDDTSDSDVAGAHVRP